MLIQKTFGSRYDDHYICPSPSDPDDDNTLDDIVIDEDAPGQRKTVNILCISNGYLGVRPFPAECDVIVVDGNVFVAGQDEYNDRFMPE